MPDPAGGVSSTGSAGGGGGVSAGGASAGGGVSAAGAVGAAPTVTTTVSLPDGAPAVLVGDFAAVIAGLTGLIVASGSSSTSLEALEGGGSSLPTGVVAGGVGSAGSRGATGSAGTAADGARGAMSGFGAWT